MIHMLAGVLAPPPSDSLLIMDAEEHRTSRFDGIQQILTQRLYL